MFVGTRYFKPIEEKNSRIKWEQADANTALKLSLAINKYSHGIVSAKVSRIVVFFPGVILLMLLGGFLYFLGNNYSQLVAAEIVFYILYALAIVFFARHFLVSYIKFRPYLYPERQPCIWIFYAKCSDIRASGIGSDEHYYAHFQKGGGHISISITGWEYKMNPTGKEYIFYKFNDRTGNRWAAIPADKLSGFQ